jgi:hypothetical protein
VDAAHLQETTHLQATMLVLDLERGAKVWGQEYK